jgi:hypothetical protein
MQRPALSYANVMSSVAVFIALGGTSYAVARDSVGTVQLKNNAVTSGKVRNRSLTAKDIAPGVLAGGRRGPRGATGPTGAAGARGPSDAYVDSGTITKPLSTAANVPTNVAQLANLPAGSYVLSAAWQVGDFTNGGEIAGCAISVNGTGLASSSGVVGINNGSTRSLAAGTYAATTQGNTFTATLDCSADQALAVPPQVSSPRLVAIRVENVRSTP